MVKKAKKMALGGGMGTKVAPKPILAPKLAPKTAPKPLFNSTPKVVPKPIAPRIPGKGLPNMPEPPQEPVSRKPPYSMGEDGRGLPPDRNPVDPDFNRFEMPSGLNDLQKQAFEEAVRTGSMIPKMGDIEKTPSFGPVPAPRLDYKRGGKVPKMKVSTGEKKSKKSPNW